jgi:uncharacterized protein YjdB
MNKRIYVVLLVPALVLALLTTGSFATVAAAKATTISSASQQAIVQAPRSPSICYQAHVQNIGWQGWVCNGQVAGTTGQSLRMEAIRIVLRNAPRNESIRYQAHVQNIGWQGWVRDGQVAGTTGRSLRMEAIRIELVRRR